jgi:hypothetical protein
VAAGSWLVIEELLERGDPAFVEALRACDDAQKLADFAAAWHLDRRPAARRFLLDYLKRPLNAFRHEGLVKRLFKIAEGAGDDEVMAHFLVMLDRSVRRQRTRRSRIISASFTSKADAAAWEKQQVADGAAQTGASGWGRSYYAWARMPETERLLVPRGTTMPRGSDGPGQRNPRTGASLYLNDLAQRLKLRGRAPRSVHDLPEHLRKRVEEFRLFTVHTRHYLRRRAWRYFRNIAVLPRAGTPERYVPAACIALRLYEDDDVADGLELLDNWGLIHVLFHECPALWPRAHGWTLRRGHTLAELTPAPAFPELWRQNPAAILDVLQHAKCRPVRQWALFYLKKDPTLLDRTGIDRLLDLLQAPDPEVVALAAAALAKRPGLESLPAERWLRLLETTPPLALDAVCALVQAKLAPAALTLEQVVDIACNRAVPIARLGAAWLQQRTPTDADWPVLLRLIDARAEVVRPELVRWLRRGLAHAANFQPAWVLEHLDSRHADVREQGWTWLLEDRRAYDDVQLWQRLFESPYDDVRLKLIEYLENRFARRKPAVPAKVPLDPELVRLLWATVLLNIHRGSRTKPKVVEQLVRRLTEHPEDAARLLPILKVALRSVRGPEWRAGLSGVVRLFERQPELEKTLHETFPELQLVG